MAERSYPTSKEQRLHGRRRAERNYSTFKVRRGSCEEKLLIQGEEQRLRFAGAAVRRYPTSKVRETQDGRCCGRASEGRHTKTIITETSQSDHRTTVVSNSVTLSHAMWGHPRRSSHGGEV